MPFRKMLLAPAGALLAAGLLNVWMAHGAPKPDGGASDLVAAAPEPDGTGPGPIDRAIPRDHPMRRRDIRIGDMRLVRVEGDEAPRGADRGATSLVAPSPAGLSGVIHSVIQGILMQDETAPRPDGDAFEPVAGPPPGVRFGPFRLSFSGPPAGSPPGPGQPPGPPGPPAPGSPGFPETEGPENLVGAPGPGHPPHFQPGAPPDGRRPGPPRSKEQERLEQAVWRLGHEAEKEAARQELREVLDSIFDQDMASREQQVQEMESRLERLRAQYEERTRRKQEIIDLQMKVLENAASGLEFPMARAEAARMIPPPTPAGARPPQPAAPIEFQHAPAPARANVPVVVEPGNLLMEFDELRTKLLDAKAQLSQSQEQLDKASVLAQRDDLELHKDDILDKQTNARRAFELATARWESLQQQKRAIQAVLTQAAVQEHSAVVLASQNLENTQKLADSKVVSPLEVQRAQAEKQAAEARFQQAVAIMNLYEGLDEQADSASIPPAPDLPGDPAR